MGKHHILPQMASTHCMELVNDMAESISSGSTELLAMRKWWNSKGMGQIKSQTWN